MKFACSIIGRSDYYPFGKRWNDDGSATFDRWQFNGKESQDGFGIDLLDYGARMYDPETGRWLTQDPLSELIFGASPFAFSRNNPVLFVDPDGNWSYRYNWETKEYEDAEGNTVPWDMVSSWWSNELSGNSSSRGKNAMHFGFNDGMMTISNGNLFFQRYIGEIRPFEPNFFGQIEEFANGSLLGRILYGTYDDMWITFQSIVRTYPSHLNNNIVRPQEKLASGVNTLSGLLFRNFGKYLKIPTKTVNAAQFNALSRGTGITAATNGGLNLRSYNYVIRNNNEFISIYPWFNYGQSLFSGYNQNY